MPAEEVGSLAQAVLKAYNKLAELKASGAGQLAIRVAENALEKAKLAQQMATGSQQGMANVFRQGAAAVGGGGAASEAGFITPAALGNLAGGAGLIGAGGLLLGGSIPSQQQTQQMLQNPSPTWGELGQQLLSWLGQGGGQMQQPGVAGGFSPLPEMSSTPGGRAPMPTASQPVRFLPSQQQGSQFPGSPMDQQLPGGGTRRPAPQGPKRPPAPKPRPRPSSGSRRLTRR